MQVLAEYIVTIIPSVGLAFYVVSITIKSASFAFNWYASATASSQLIVLIAFYVFCISY